MFRIHPTVVRGMAMCVASTATIAAAHEFDLSPRLGDGDQIVTDAYADDDGDLVENVRVFAFEFGEIEDQPYFLQDPGFHPLPGSGFIEGTRLGFELAGPLTFWNGSGAPAFAPVTAGESLQFSFGSQSIFSTGDMPASGTGLEFVTVDASGEADDHVETFLLAAATPADGLYLASVRVTGTDLAASEPVYWLFANGVDESAILSAALHVRDTHAPGSNLAVPEPSTLASLAVAGSLLRRRRSRR